MGFSEYVVDGQKSTVARRWTLAQVCEYAQISRSTVWRLMKAGKLHGTRIGRVWRFDPEEVMRDLGQSQTNDGINTDAAIA